MVIKLKCISAAYGFNTVSNVLGKNSSNPNYVKPVFLGSNHLPVDDITGESIEPDCAWDSMRIIQANSWHKVKNPFFRITICPTKEECNGWSMEDWRLCLDDAIRHLDNTDYRGKSGEVIGPHTELSNCQWVAAVHLLPDNLCIHLIANRITENDKCQSSHQTAWRAIMAANAMAEERGWVKAMDVHSKKRREK